MYKLLHVHLGDHSAYQSGLIALGTLDQSQYCCNIIICMELIASLQLSAAVLCHTDTAVYIMPILPIK